MDQLRDHLPMAGDVLQEVMATPDENDTQYGDTAIRIISFGHGKGLVVEVAPNHIFRNSGDIIVVTVVR